MMKSYRVEYSEVKPGGTQVRQCDKLTGEVRDVVIHLARRRIVEGSVKVFEFTKSDGEGVCLGSLGW